LSKTSDQERKLCQYRAFLESSPFLGYTPWSFLNRESAVQPRKVLVVDDSKLMHKMYEVMLRQYPLVYALDGRQALDRLREHPDTDLVLLDINMPNMNGLEFLAALRSDGTQADLPVIIISTEGRDEDTARGLEAGATAYIRKPFQTEEILDVIARLQTRDSA
jgi:two-component system, chemotaxis family, chemotaxis protein CheY